MLTYQFALWTIVWVILVFRAMFSKLRSQPICKPENNKVGYSQHKTINKKKQLNITHNGECCFVELLLQMPTYRYMYVYICICTHTHIPIYIYMWMCNCINIWICIIVCMYMENYKNVLLVDCRVKKKKV